MIDYLMLWLPRLCAHVYTTQTATELTRSNPLNQPARSAKDVAAAVVFCPYARRILEAGRVRIRVVVHATGRRRLHLTLAVGWWRVVVEVVLLHLHLHLLHLLLLLWRLLVVPRRRQLQSVL